MAISLILVPTIFTALFCALHSNAVLGDSQTPIHISLRTQLQDAKLKLSRLVEEYDDSLNAKCQYIEGIEKKLEEISFDIDRLKTALSSFKDQESNENQRLTLLEEEVQLLWATSRENNFEIHKLTLDAQESEERLKDVASKVEKAAAIVNEQWIQVQQLEQAAQLAEIRVLKVKSQLRYGRCPFVKSIKNLSSHHIEMLKGLLRSNSTSDQNSYMSKALHQFEKTFAAIKLHHHQLQGFLKQAVEQYDFPTVLANDELVFLVASALVVFPVLGALTFLISHLN
ncbi:PREDICTED: uncharacterized protein LOC109164679 isoform X2 [Ipomoea nil]|uniref:uncharacterized protein LOC109164679 isoform X2 n=1 Tax=Ipomoea nil TaxID=35883 RepID=UPI0009016601|nr:PREDICTED: uncharacterized protein LOC109164679 isoform X2 [Ipomoea nil]